MVIENPALARKGGAAWLVATESLNSFKNFESFSPFPRLYS
jgi:hypothetical protein